MGRRARHPTRRFGSGIFVKEGRRYLSQNAGTVGRFGTLGAGTALNMREHSGAFLVRQLASRRPRLVPANIA
jgi:hypothetical protein